MNAFPEHMRVRYEDSIFWNEETVADCELFLDKPVLNVVPISSCTVRSVATDKFGCRVIRRPVGVLPN